MRLRKVEVKSEGWKGKNEQFEKKYHFVVEIGTSNERTYCEMCNWSSCKWIDVLIFHGKMAIANCSKVSNRVGSSKDRKKVIR